MSQREKIMINLRIKTEVINGKSDINGLLQHLVDIELTASFYIQACAEI